MQYEYHEVANIFPLLKGDEYESLKEDIKQNGLLEAIWLYDEKIIDGRNRYRACLDTGVEPKFRVWNGLGSLVSFVVSLNLHRRHLTSSQAAMVSLDVMPMLEKEARERQVSLAGTRPSTNLSQLFDEGPDSNSGKATEQAAKLFNTNRQYVSDAKNIQDKSPEIAERVRNGELSIPQAKIEINRLYIPEEAVMPELPKGKYRCIVLDPPWPMKKIEREERPNQGYELDYPTMTLEDIANLPVSSMADEEGCHVYLWVTQKYLPYGLELFNLWGVKYQCLMTWVKPTGITPYSWMYNTEHVIFGRIGSLQLDRLGLKLSFEEAVKGHSIKPDIFYTRVLEASPEPRIDMFARRQRDGFEVWGNEV